ncbi:hypothetical protein [Microbacterium sp.]|uniref:DUF7665 family protein n=1 Tax=Microbacterium sp. TaxID=51671 RepID=UPI002810EFB4|nr:hypothetical protein [Microbacterium sp.]
MTEAADPARVAIEEDLQSASVLDGVENGRWRVVSLVFPVLIVAVIARDGRELGMRVDVSGYPTAAPAGIPWHLAAGRPLVVAELPTGPAAHIVFHSQWSQLNGWTPYMATERLIIQKDHPEWATVHPGRAWNPTRTIAFYLTELHKELRSCTIPAVSA